MFSLTVSFVFALIGCFSYMPCECFQNLMPLSDPVKEPLILIQANTFSSTLSLQLNFDWYWLTELSMPFFEWSE